MPVMMKCGHAANAVRTSDDAPVCAICVGLTPDATIIDDVQPDLAGRIAKCSYDNGRDKQGTHTNKKVPSHPGLAFFRHQPDKEFDEYYCGCWGWD